MEVLVKVKKEFTAPCGELFSVVKEGNVIFWASASSSGNVTVSELKGMSKSLKKCTCTSNCYSFETPYYRDYTYYADAIKHIRLYERILKHLKIK